MPGCAGRPWTPAIGKPVRRAEVIPLTVAADDRTHLRRALMPERSVEETARRGQLRQDRGGPDRRAWRTTRPAAACAATSASAAACAWPPAARWASRRCAWPTRRPAGSPTSTSRGRPSCASAAAPARRSARRARSASRISDGVRRTIITGTVVREQPLLACSRVRCADADTRAPGVRPSSACRITWRPTSIVSLCPTCARRRADRPAVSASGRPR
ncbi:MAG: hypothetical protein MZV65_18435 [Chromatiales bacterium]|nr:hypothetical protein [Chromatiales bacterium]